MSFVNRSRKRKEEIESAEPARDEAWEARHPALHEFVTATSCDGKQRQTAALTLFTDEGKFKLFVNDKEEEESFCVAADSFSEVFDKADQAIQDGTAEWRVAKQKKRK